MSKTLSSQAVWSMVGTGVLVLVLGFVFYSYLNLPKATAQATPTTYSLGALQEMQSDSSGSKANVFEKAGALRSVPQSQDQSIQYNQSELGKTDLSRPE